MFDVNDDAKVEFRRVEMLTGPGRRRRWSAEEKARIAARIEITQTTFSAQTEERPRLIAYKALNVPQQTAITDCRVAEQMLSSTVPAGTVL